MGACKSKNSHKVEVKTIISEPYRCNPRLKLIGYLKFTYP